jgi:hypothetical protein
VVLELVIGAMALDEAGSIVEERDYIEPSSIVGQLEAVSPAP